MPSTPLSPLNSPGSAQPRTQARSFAWFCVLLLSILASALHAAEVGVIGGAVSNNATGNLLEGARIVDALPLNATGKVQKFKLREIAGEA